VRRILQHALVAAGISALAAGAVAGTFVTSSAQEVSQTVASPVVSYASPSGAHSTLISSSALDAAKATERVARENRGTQRVALSAAAAAESVRDRALIKQHHAIEKEQEALQQKKEALKQKKEERAKKQAALAKKRAAAAAKAKKLSSGNPKDIARAIMKSKYGWGSSQFSCYNKIIMRESMWKVHADNPTSSAYGIPQALPGRKMASAGPDWRNNPATQIKWGLGYVKSRYGTPCGAWGFKSSHGWY
jgi:hypothetical protein